MTKQLCLVNGPNLGLLGMRDPARYGTTTLKEIEASVKQLCEKNGVELVAYQNDVEGNLIQFLNEQFVKHTKGTTKIVGVIVNPGGYGHTSVALRDSLENISMAKIPVIEVHLSNIFAREEFRRHTLIGEVASGVVSGLGAFGYTAAAAKLLESGASS